MTFGCGLDAVWGGELCSPHVLSRVFGLVSVLLAGGFSDDVEENVSTTFPDPDLPSLFMVMV